VILRRGAGLTELNRAPLPFYQRIPAERTTAITADGTRVLRCVEHLFAALGGLGLHRDVSVELSGGEVPFLDGGAAAFARALMGLGIAASEPRFRVVHDQEVEIGPSIYRFRRASTVELSVELSFPDARLSPRAEWHGDAADFVERIAPARTFIFARELATAEVAFFADAGSVVVLDEDRVLCAGAPFVADEPARHKLLDLIGDLYLYGGPPLGRMEVHRPGHAATHAAVAAALSMGILAISE
jgi:UDP-3-O-[3-hydroxymyristoyl] N-acetylglucosamine deacetylase